MKKLIKLIMVALMMMLVLTPTTASAKTHYTKDCDGVKVPIRATIKTDKDIKKVLPKVLKELKKDNKYFCIKIKGNKKQSFKKLRKLEQLIVKSNNNGVYLTLYPEDYGLKTKKGYTYYIFETHEYIYYNQIVDKMEEEVTTWVQSLTPEQQAKVASTPRYIVGSGQKTFGQLSDYEKIKFISDHQVFSCTHSPKNHVGMYYLSMDKWTSEKGSLLTGNAYGICENFAGVEHSMFSALGIYTCKGYGNINHAWTEIYMQDPETGEYRWYLFDYGLFEDINAVSRTGATLYESSKSVHCNPEEINTGYKWCNGADAWVRD